MSFRQAITRARPVATHLYQFTGRTPRKCLQTGITFSCDSRIRTRAFNFTTVQNHSRGLTTSAPAPETIRILRDVADVRAFRQDAFRQDKLVGLVPTMGALHKGHLSLTEIAAAETDHVIVSIYVNPTQFGVNEDLDAYPRTFESDIKMLQDMNITLASRNARGRITAVFCPTTKTMYPVMPPTSEVNGHGSFVIISPLGQILEGASRPVFFRGVATVCMKLFNIVQADQVYFGQKDVQQSRVILRLVKDFHLKTVVRICPTSREPDGLALSSRNVFLGSRRRTAGVVLIQALRLAEKQYMDGKTRVADIMAPVEHFVRHVRQTEESKPPYERALFDVDYISITDPDTMEPIETIDSRGAVLSGAVIMQPLKEIQTGEDEGEANGARRPVRLIDNIIISPKSID